MDTRILLNIFVSWQHHFPSPALQVFSIRMRLNIVSVISHLRHYEYSAYGCTWTLSASFLISGITSIQHIDVLEHSQRHSLFSALQTFSISFGGELYLSRFIHLIFRLYYFDFGLLCRDYPSCLHYLIQGRVSPIKALVSDSSALLLRPWTILQTSSFFKRGGVLSTALLLRPWTTLQTSFVYPLVSHAEDSLYVENILN